MAKYEVIGNVYVNNKQLFGSPDGANNPEVELEPKDAEKAVMAGNLRPMNADAKKAAKDLEVVAPVVEPEEPEPREPKGKKK